MTSSANVPIFRERYASSTTINITAPMLTLLGSRWKTSRMVSSMGGQLGPLLVVKPNRAIAGTFPNRRRFDDTSLASNTAFPPLGHRTGGGVCPLIAQSRRIALDANLSFSR
eukprot:CAMPEP_0196827406 /NCGR_PEP_ID=MMETSP1362-20130617/94137_1 /TAXON_ID=163516 /ORGANISM="Leptocylindrus danicus, Strain CCMP1856" /LENGTH=111 /DNA_ID=CAMNT_0042208037 /DNA_START=1985 /DNA_END=2320 /DNA_ORIENTATION=+